MAAGRKVLTLLHSSLGKLFCLGDLFIAFLTLQDSGFGGLVVSMLAAGSIPA
jgi:hypothetical protein